MNYRREDVANAPLRILRQQTRRQISLYLDGHKLLLSEGFIHRDWRGLAEKAEIDISALRSSKISPTEHTFYLWIQKGGLVKDFWNALECMDRYDVIDDTLQNIYDDYDYLLSRDTLGLKAIPPCLDEIYPTIAEFDSNILTTDDQRNLNDGRSLQFYDALVLFADEDLDFVDKMVQKLEGEYNLKLCLKDRDLIGGLSFESSAIIRLIEERCARVIVVLSPFFLQSNANKFLTKFAHSLSIEHQRRILIPCMVTPCQKPLEISYCHSLDYFRTKGYWDYWKKLADSITYSENHSRTSNSRTETAVAHEILPIQLPALPATSTEVTSLTENSNDKVHILDDSRGTLQVVLPPKIEKIETGVPYMTNTSSNLSATSNSPLLEEDYVPNYISSIKDHIKNPKLDSSHKKNFRHRLRKALKLPKKQKIKS